MLTCGPWSFSVGSEVGLTSQRLCYRPTDPGNLYLENGRVVPMASRPFFQRQFDTESGSVLLTGHLAITWPTVLIIGMTLYNLGGGWSNSLGPAAMRQVLNTVAGELSRMGFRELVLKDIDRVTGMRDGKMPRFDLRYDISEGTARSIH